MNSAQFSSTATYFYVTVESRPATPAWQCATILVQILFCAKSNITVRDAKHWVHSCSFEWLHIVLFLCFDYNIGTHMTSSTPHQRFWKHHFCYNFRLSTRSWSWPWKLIRTSSCCNWPLVFDINFAKDQDHILQRVFNTLCNIITNNHSFQ